MSAYDTGTAEGYPPLDIVDPAVAFDDEEQLLADPFDQAYLAISEDVSGAHDYVNLKTGHQVGNNERNRAIWQRLDTDPEARDELILSNDRLVAKVAHRFMYLQHETLQPADIMQAGRIGLMRALGTWQPEQGDLAPHLSQHALRAIRRERDNTDRIVRLPVNRVADMRMAGRLLEENPGITAAEIAEKMRIKTKTLVFGGPGKGTPSVYTRTYKAEDYVRYLLYRYEHTSTEPYDEPDGDRQTAGSAYYNDLTAEHNPEEVVAYHDDLKFAHHLLAELQRLDDKRLHDVIWYSQGFGGEALTHDRIAEKLGITRSRVGQLYERAMGILRELASGVPLKWTNAYQNQKHTAHLRKPYPPATE